MSKTLRGPNDGRLQTLLIPVGIDKAEPTPPETEPIPEPEPLEEAEEAEVEEDA